MGFRHLVQIQGTNENIQNVCVFTKKRAPSSLRLIPESFTFYIRVYFAFLSAVGLVLTSQMMCGVQQQQQLFHSLSVRHVCMVITISPDAH